MAPFIPYGFFPFGSFGIRVNNGKSRSASWSLSMIKSRVSCGLLFKGLSISRKERLAASADVTSSVLLKFSFSPACSDAILAESAANMAVRFSLSVEYILLYLGSFTRWAFFTRHHFSSSSTGSSRLGSYGTKFSFSKSWHLCRVEDFNAGIASLRVNRKLLLKVQNT